MWTWKLFTVELYYSIVCHPDFPFVISLFRLAVLYVRHLFHVSLSWKSDPSCYFKYFQWFLGVLFFISKSMIDICQAPWGKFVICDLILQRICIQPKERLLYLFVTTLLNIMSFSTQVLIAVLLFWEVLFCTVYFKCIEWHIPKTTQALW